MTTSTKQYNDTGIDWLDVVIPPLNDEEAEYTVRVHMTFLMSNWTCIFGSGCPGMFGKQSSTYPDDVGCCVDSFYFADEDEVGFVEGQMAKLTDADWDSNLRKHVEKHGFVNQIASGEDTWDAKGRVHDGGCVFQNRNNGSVGKPGCAFHWLAERTGDAHVDTMPAVCWQLPLRINEEDDETGVLVTIHPWNVSEWSKSGWEYDDRSSFCSWWCVDSPDAYVGKVPVYKGMEQELRRMLKDRPYELVVAAIEKRKALGFQYPPMPGAVINEGRPLLPLLVGNRTPVREPSYMPDHIEKLKADANGEAD